METETVNPFDLKPNHWNSNRVSRDNFEKLKKSLVVLGSFKPVLVRQLEDDSYEILGGFHRVEAAKELGFSTIPIWNVGKIDDDRAKEISLVDNTRYGEDDIEALSKLLDSFETDLLSDIIPDSLPIELPDTDDALTKLTKELKEASDEEGSHRVLKFRLETEKADKVEALLNHEAKRLGFTFADGYLNLSEALHFVVQRYDDEF